MGPALLPAKIVRHIEIRLKTPHTGRRTAVRGVLALEWTEGKTERRSPKTVKACRRSRQPRGVWHASCWRKTLRLNRLLRPAGRAIMRAAARGKGAALEKRQDPRGALPFFSPAASPKRRAKTFDYDALIFLFAAQPIKVFRRGLFSKRPERSRLSFSPRPFFKKAGAQPTKFFAEAFFQKGRSAAD